MVLEADNRTTQATQVVKAAGMCVHNQAREQSKAYKQAEERRQSIWWAQCVHWRNGHGSRKWVAVRALG